MTHAFGLRLDDRVRQLFPVGVNDIADVRRTSQRRRCRRKIVPIERNARGALPVAVDKHRSGRRKGLLTNPGRAGLRAAAGLDSLVCRARQACKLSPRRLSSCFRFRAPLLRSRPGHGNPPVPRRVGHVHSQKSAVSRFERIAGKKRRDAESAEDLRGDGAAQRRRHGVADLPCAAPLGETGSSMPCNLAISRAVTQRARS